MKRSLPLLLILLLLLPLCAYGAPSFPTVTVGVGEAKNPAEVSTALQVMLVFTILSVAPAILLMTTAFTRIVIVLSFVRHAMGTQQAPPNQVIVGLALFLTFFVMAPVFGQINNEALQPYMKKEIQMGTAIDKAVGPMREFMFSQTTEKELQLLMDITKAEAPKNRDEVPTTTLIPAFMLSELKRAFQMGFLIFIPFLVIDMVVASILMSMGMMMLPPVIISLPFKILLFVLVDGWNLVVGSLVQSFY